MIENLKNINDRNIKLAKFTEDDLDQLYYRVFNGEDGALVMQDLANRSYAEHSTNDGDDIVFNEGMRSLYISIVSRLKGAVAPKKEE